MVIDGFRARAGRVGGPFEGSELILLTTTGARSGKPHTVPLGFLRDGGDGGDLLVVGSAAGADRHPAWYHNLLARPLVQVETGAEEYAAVAVPAQGARRDELFARVVREAPGYGEYQARTRRVLPVVALQRTHRTASGEGEGGIAGKLLDVHGWLRAQLALVRDLVREEPGGGGPLPLGLQLRQHCLAFCHSLEFHHKSEDAGLFPYLEQQHSHMREFFRRLDAEHRVIARLQHELVQALDAPDGAGFGERVERLSRELEAHLDAEEEQLLPVLRALGA
ncbi:nitroreductase/quinone reductase family protein [Streptomyces sp. NPDC005533]|uniref:nitroreductase/quinone reductase family protein n=1 Tax=Streptomyces sp. NPDC005533 TaxID=3364723 RepID=UPI00368C8865